MEYLAVKQAREAAERKMDTLRAAIKISNDRAQRAAGEKKAQVVQQAAGHRKAG